MGLFRTAQQVTIIEACCAFLLGDAEGCGHGLSLTILQQPLACTTLEKPQDGKWIAYRAHFAGQSNKLPVPGPAAHLCTGIEMWEDVKAF